MKTALVLMLTSLALSAQASINLKCSWLLSQIIQSGKNSMIQQIIKKETEDGLREVDSLIEKAVSNNEFYELFVGGYEYGYITNQTFHNRTTDYVRVWIGLDEYASKHVGIIDRKVQEAVEKMAHGHDMVEVAISILNHNYFHSVDKKQPTAIRLDLIKIATIVQQTLMSNEEQLKSETRNGISIWRYIQLKAKDMELYGGPNYFPEKAPIQVQLSSLVLLPNREGTEDFWYFNPVTNEIMKVPPKKRN